MIWYDIIIYIYIYICVNASSSLVLLFESTLNPHRSAAQSDDFCFCQVKSGTIGGTPDLKGKISVTHATIVTKGHMLISNNP